MLNAIIKWIVWLVSIAIFSVLVVALGGRAPFIRRPVGALYVVL
jgi:hypothetical protein